MDFIPSTQEMLTASLTIVVVLIGLGILEQNFPTIARISKGQN